MSALPPIADKQQTFQEVRLGPQTDIVASGGRRPSIAAVAIAGRGSVHLPACGGLTAVEAVRLTALLMIAAERWSAAHLKGQPPMGGMLVQCLVFHQ